MSDLDRSPRIGDAGLDVVVMRPPGGWGRWCKKGQIRAIDSFLADPTLQDASFQPQQHLFPVWWRELSSYGDKDLWVSLYQPHNIPVLSQRSAGGRGKST